MKIVFFGTGEFSRNILEGILKDKSIDVGLVVSQPDKPIGRKKIITKTPVKILAEENNIKILQPEKLKNNTEFFKELEGFDFIVVVAYGKIVPNEVLDAPKYGCINIHGSILPKYRGASPIQEAIKNGDLETGLTIMYMSAGMDEGDILDIKKVNIDKLDKTIDIFKKFEEIGVNLLINTLNGILDGTVKGKKQDDKKASYCSKISKKDGEINFKKDSGIDIYNKYKSYYSWPGIYTFYNNKKLNLEEVELIDNEIASDIGEVIKTDLDAAGPYKKNIGITTIDNKILILRQVKLEGKKSMDILSFINGNNDFLDYKF
ncbi:MAG: methionyl-tRNA formyltransferase [Candidatus Gracilibacteria bacterium]